MEAPSGPFVAMNGGEKGRGTEAEDTSARATGVGRPVLPSMCGLSAR
jgi:hypothetical protein